jgi:hypothetical protein
MPSRIDTYRAFLRHLPNREPYLLANSNLPGPRSNLELLYAVMEEGSEAEFRRWADLGPDIALTNTPHEFLVCCGVAGLGALLARGDRSPFPILRERAADSRWRVREAVAMALQRWGDADMPALLAEMTGWAQDAPLVQRATAAGLCEPRLLKDPAHAAAVLGLLDAITRRLAQGPASERKTDGFKTLRQALSYCWSVAVVSLPETGKPLMEKWLNSPDPDVQWLMRENLRKNRLAKMDPDWVKRHSTHRPTD